MDVRVEPLTTADDVEWCAALMSGSEPWITLKRSRDACRAALSNPVKERYVVRADGSRVGLLVLDMTGPFAGYIQSIAVAPEARGRGIGSRVLAWAEERIFRESANVFMLVSSFNADAQRLYARLGFERVGVLRSYVVAEHDEILLRKTSGPLLGFRPGFSPGIPRAH